MGVRESDQEKKLGGIGMRKFVYKIKFMQYEPTMNRCFGQKLSFFNKLIK